MNRKPDTSWEEVEKWYDSLVGYWGQYYHTHVIIPNLKKLMCFTPTSSLLDLACGQGVLARHIDKTIAYTGVDLSSSLIEKAKQYASSHSMQHFITADITKPLPLSREVRFTHCTCILALQNVEHPEKVISNAAHHLHEKGKFFIVLNHPCFRIPRQSSWGFNDATKIQFRQVNGYMSSQKIPITHRPSQKERSETSWSYHWPLSAYFQWLNKAGFTVSSLEEWCSDKKSIGKTAQWENRAREEFPLFLSIVARK